MLTKQTFLDRYSDKLLSTHPWTKEEGRLDRFMASVRATLNGAALWNHDSDAARAVWRASGPKGVRYSLKALRSLPD